MSIYIKRNMGVSDTAEFFANSIIKHLNEGKKVLWFATGGSSIKVGVEVSKIISKYPHQNLTVTLTDERYGDVGHKNSNWQELLEKGFNLPEAKLIPVLYDMDMESTVKNFNKILREELDLNDYKIGLFGIGKDGHTAGILPESPALDVDSMVCGYNTPEFKRITITPIVIRRLDEAVVFMQGVEKWQALENFEDNIEVFKQPAQLLKEVPILTVFTDNIKK